MDRRSGYTLLELMIVVVLIGISVAIAVPTVSSALADQKQAEAALQVISVYRSARATAMRVGSPTLVVASASNSGQFWIVTAPRQAGVAQSCRRVDWAADPGVLALPASPDLDFGAGTGPEQETFDWDRYAISATFNVDAPSLCYSPLGRAYLASGVAGPYSDLQSTLGLGGALQIQVARQFSNPRLVVVPLGSGMPRLGLL